MSARRVAMRNVGGTLCVMRVPPPQPRARRDVTTSSCRSAVAPWRHGCGRASYRSGRFYVTADTVNGPRTRHRCGGVAAMCFSSAPYIWHPAYGASICRTGTLDPRQGRAGRRVKCGHRSTIRVFAGPPPLPPAPRRVLITSKFTFEFSERTRRVVIWRRETTIGKSLSAAFV